MDALVPKWRQANSRYCSQINKFNNVYIASDALTSNNAKPPVGITKYQISKVIAGVLAPGWARPSASTVLFRIVCHVLEVVDVLAPHGARPPPVGITKYQISKVIVGVLAPGCARPSASTVLFRIVCHVLEVVDVLAPHGARPSVYKEREQVVTVAVDVLAPMVPGHQQRQCSDAQCLPWLINKYPNYSQITNVSYFI